MHKRTINLLATQAYNIGNKLATEDTRWGRARLRDQGLRVRLLAQGTPAESVVYSQLMVGFEHGQGSRNK